MDAAEIERCLIERSVAADGPELTGPVHVLDTAKGVDGGSTYHVSAAHLVRIDDDDPDLAGVSIPVPTTAAVEVDGSGAIVGIDVPSDPEAQRQARAFTRTLIAQGAVSGLVERGPARRGPGPPTRATHALTIDEYGRRVIRRSGFTIAGATTAGPVLDAGAHDDQQDDDVRQGATR